MVGHSHLPLAVQRLHGQLAQGSKNQERVLDEQVVCAQLSMRWACCFVVFVVRYMAAYRRMGWFPISYDQGRTDTLRLPKTYNT